MEYSYHGGKLWPEVESVEIRKMIESVDLDLTVAGGGYNANYYRKPF